MRQTVQITMEDGDSFVTQINGTEDDAQDYYKPGTVLNMGSVYDRMVRIKTIEILNKGNA